MQKLFSIQRDKENILRLEKFTLNEQRFNTQKVHIYRIDRLQNKVNHELYLFYYNSFYIENCLRSQHLDFPLYLSMHDINNFSQY